MFSQPFHRVDFGNIDTFLRVWFHKGMNGRFAFIRKFSDNFFADVITSFVLVTNQFAHVCVVKGHDCIENDEKDHAK